MRRAKLYYIRDRVGKSAKVAELITRKPRKDQGAPRPVESRSAEVAAGAEKQSED